MLVTHKMAFFEIYYDAIDYLYKKSDARSHKMVGHWSITPWILSFKITQHLTNYHLNTSKAITFLFLANPIEIFFPSISGTL